MVIHVHHMYVSLVSVGILSGPLDYLQKFMPVVQNFDLPQHFKFKSSLCLSANFQIVVHFGKN